MFWDAYTWGNGSYTYGGDMNGDGISGNDLLYVPRNTSEMNFVDIKSGSTVLFTAAQQAAAWDKYINQDNYLNTRRGQYAERGGAFIPMISRADVSIVQSVFADILETKQTLEIRLDILNIGNMLKNSWGQSQHFVNPQPLIVATNAQGGPVSSSGLPQYTMRVVNGALMDHTFDKNAALSDVYSLQLSLKYFF
jgi:hypothetical protein